MIVFKICTRAEWENAVREGVYRGSRDDLRDGFIHFSLRDQLEGTAKKHFAGQRDLVLVSVPRAALGDALVLEPSRGGALFPHLYGTLDPELAIEIAPLPWDETRGEHAFPTSGVTSPRTRARS